MMLFHNLATLLIPFAMSLWVFFDASRNGINKRPGGGFPNFTPGGWATLCLFFNVFGTLFYVIKRKSLIANKPEAPGPRGTRLYSVAIVIMIGITGFTVWFSLKLANTLPRCQDHDTYFSVSDEVNRKTGKKWVIHIPTETAYEDDKKRSCQIKFSSEDGQEMIVAYDVEWKDRGNGLYTISIRDNKEPVVERVPPPAVKASAPAAPVPATGDVKPAIAAATGGPPGGGSPSTKASEPDHGLPAPTKSQIRRKALPAPAVKSDEVQTDYRTDTSALTKSRGRIVYQSEHALVVVHEYEEPSKENNLIAMGRSHLNTGQINESIGFFNEAIEADPHNYLAYRLRGNAYDNLGDRQRAIEDWQMAARLGDRIIQSYLKHIEVNY